MKQKTTAEDERFRDRDAFGLEPKRPSLVHITTVPQTLGFLIEQIRVMQCKGFDVHVVSSPGEQLDRIRELEGVTVHPVQMHRRITPFRDLVALVRIWRTLRSIRPLIVHAHTPKGGLLGIIAAWTSLVPVRIYSILGLPSLTAKAPKKILLKYCEQITCHLAHRILAISESIREIVVESKVCSETKIKVLHKGGAFGVDALDRFNPAKMEVSIRATTRAKLGAPTDSLVVGFIGRIVKDKGIYELMNAWKQLRVEFARLHLIVVGSFEAHDPLDRDLRERIIGDSRIHMIGQVADPSPYYAAMDLLAMPTYREGFGQVLIEAAAMELPVVATCVPGCVDSVQHGITGTLVPARNAQALADAIRVYLNDPALRQNHGRAGRRRALSDFSNNVLSDATYREYADLVRSKKLPFPLSRPSAYDVADMISQEPVSDKSEKHALRK